MDMEVDMELQEKQWRELPFELRNKVLRYLDEWELRSYATIDKLASEEISMRVEEETRVVILDIRKKQLRWHYAKSFALDAPRIYEILYDWSCTELSESRLPGEGRFLCGRVWPTAVCGCTDRNARPAARNFHLAIRHFCLYMKTFRSGELVIDFNGKAMAMQTAMQWQLRLSGPLQPVPRVRVSRWCRAELVDAPQHHPHITNSCDYDSVSRLLCLLSPTLLYSDGFSVPFDRRDKSVCGANEKDDNQFYEDQVVLCSAKHMSMPRGILHFPPHGYRHRVQCMHIGRMIGSVRGMIRRWQRDKIDVPALHCTISSEILAYEDYSPPDADLRNGVRHSLVLMCGSRESCRCTTYRICGKERSDQNDMLLTLRRRECDESKSEVKALRYVPVGQPIPWLTCNEFPCCDPRQPTLPAVCDCFACR